MGFKRALNNVFVIRRHGTGNVIYQARLVARHLVEHAAFANTFGGKATDNGNNYFHCAFGIQKGLHAVPAADAAFGREQMAQSFS